METKVVKISEENYRWFVRFAAELQRIRGVPVSFDKAFKELKTKASARDALLAVAGSWSMSDFKAKRLEKENRRLWKTWKPSSV